MEAKGNEPAAARAVMTPIGATQPISHNDH